MAIDWEKGEIDNRPHILRPDQIYTTFEELQPPAVVYIGAEDDSMSPDDKNRLWIAPRAPVYNEFEASFLREEMYLCRLILVKEGAIIDASTGDFVLNGRPWSRKLERSHSMSSDLDLESLAEIGIRPVAGVIENDEQREALGRMVFSRYGLILDASALAMPNPED